MKIILTVTSDVEAGSSNRTLGNIYAQKTCIIFQKERSVCCIINCCLSLTVHILLLCIIYTGEGAAVHLLKG
jgi:hypothetical protein